MSSESLTSLSEWGVLAELRRGMEGVRISDFFAEDGQRFERCHVALDGVVFDYSKQCVTADVLDGLVALAEARGLAEARTAMFCGDVMNSSEGRAALHTALRGLPNGRGPVKVRDEVQSDFRVFCDVVERLRGRADVHDVIVIGVGGSMVAPQMVCEALKGSSDGPRVHFLSNVDGQSVAQLKDGLCPAHTVVVVISKTFTTAETMANAALFKDWVEAGNQIAVTVDAQKALDFGIEKENILLIREWVGGRYSVWSSVGLPVALAIGVERFKEFLVGAHVVDGHFKDAPLKKNIPVLMAMIGIWNCNFLGYGAQAIVPYADQLRLFPSYIQQIDMESNGKGVTQEGEAVEYQTGPLIVGGVGTDAQHAFFQHLHQGTSITPVDFLVFARAVEGYEGHHMKLVSNALAQAQALMNGRVNEDEPHKHFEGNRPSSMLVFEELSAREMGMVMALYEHKIFVQGVIWGINSFDQWGVELGKILVGDIERSFETSEGLKDGDSSTVALMDVIRKTNLW